MKNIIWSIGHKLQLKDIVRADNCHLYDSNGNKYIDLESGVWCTCLGHGNKRINRIIKSQIDKIAHTGFCYRNPIVEKTASKVLEITGLENGKCEFICSGSEAVEYGMKVAKSIVKNPLTLTFTDSYFGAYGEASRRAGKNWHLFNWLECSCNSEAGCVGNCKEFNAIPFKKIGIFLFEPGSSSGLVRFPSIQLIKKIADKINENKGLILINEVTTGIGRTGKWFGFQHYTIKPDIIAIGKGIGNGYPVSVAVISEDVSKQLLNTNFLYSQSHQNDPLGASVAGEVLDTIKEEELIERCNRIGNLIMGHINAIKHKHGIIKEIRGRGLMIAIELYNHADLVHQQLLDKGFILVKRGGVEVLRMDPALTIEENDIKKFLTIFEQIIEKIKKSQK